MLGSHAPSWGLGRARLDGQRREAHKPKVFHRLGQRRRQRAVPPPKCALAHRVHQAQQVAHLRAPRALSRVAVGHA